MPHGWRDTDTIHLDRTTFADAAALTAAVETLRELRLGRIPHVVLLDPALPWPALLAPRSERRPPWRLGPVHRLLHDELAFHLAGLIDARGGTPAWWPAVHAARLGARPAADPPGRSGTLGPSGPDVLLPDGRPAWVDAGPRGPVDGWPDDAVRIHAESVRGCKALSPERDAPPTERLSAEQLAAVTHRCGPARVLAPAGSGKTRVLAARLRHLVHDRGVQPTLITALAYNTRAARELAGRTRDVHADGQRPRIRTVHALGLTVCAAAAGRRPQVLDGDGAIARVREAASGLPGTANVDPELLLAALREVRLGLRDPAAVEAARGDVPGLARLVPRYRARLAAEGAVDFDEQVLRAVTLLLADPALRRRVGRTARHLLVDEAQDLVPAFVLLVRLLAGPAQQLFAVGDDDQTIYGYAGADPRVLVDLPAAYRGMTSYTLRVNRRCPPPVVRAASALLAHNTVRVDKAVRPAPGAPDDPDALRVVDARAGDGAATTVAAVEGLLSADVGSVAVLGRVGAALLAPQAALRLAGVPVHRHLGPDVLGRTGLSTTLAYLRVAVDPDRIDPADLAATLRRPARRLTGVVPPGPTSLGRLARQVGTVDAEHRAALRRYVDDVAHLAGLVRDGADTARLLRAVREDVGLGVALDALDRRRHRPEGSSAGDDLEALAELAPLLPDPAALPATLPTLLTDPPSGPGDAGTAGGAAPDAVTVSTVHRVKGREWDGVVLVGVRAGLVPHRLCDDVEEERRVLHVALTRARRRLILLADPDRPSPLLPELLGTVRPASADPDGTVLAALRRWRSARAAADRVPAFLVAHDRTLVDVARRQPCDLAALRTCHGIGPTRAERYGAELLRLVADPASYAPPPRPDDGSGRGGRHRGRP